MRFVVPVVLSLLGCATPARPTDLLGELALNEVRDPLPPPRPRALRVIRIGAPTPAAPPVEEAPPSISAPRVLAAPTPPRARRASARPWNESGPPLVVAERLAVVPLPGAAGASSPSSRAGALAATSPGSTQTLVPQASTGVLDREASDAYDSALSLVRTDRCHDAVNAFASFVARWPNHPHADNAMYWRGECLLRLGETRRGIDELDALLRRYPTGNKAPDALLKLFLTWRRLGDEARASEAATRLLRDFPGSDAARRAQAERQMR